MLTIGVDLAAEPKGTAVAGIEWADGRAKLVNLMLGATDGYIVEASSSAGKIGIDCALGVNRDGTRLGVPVFHGRRRRKNRNHLFPARSSNGHNREFLDLVFH